MTEKYRSAAWYAAMYRRAGVFVGGPASPEQFVTAVDLAFEEGLTAAEQAAVPMLKDLDDQLRIASAIRMLKKTPREKPLSAIEERRQRDGRAGLELSDPLNIDEARWTLEKLGDALRAAQSTDDPDFVPTYEALAKKYTDLKKRWGL